MGFNKQETMDMVVELGGILETLKGELNHKEVPFEFWRSYMDKVDYSYRLGINTPVGKFINDFIPWVWQERYRILDLETILSCIEEISKSSKVNDSEFQVLKEYLQEINFGSMIIDW